MLSRLAVPILFASLASLLVACSTSPTSPSSLHPAPLNGVSSTAGLGDGNTPARLTLAGWMCLNVPGHGVHCIVPKHTFGDSVAIPVKVFDTSDPNDDEAAFLGTESLIRADQYRGQPCLPGHDEYVLLPFGYYACHHFDF